MLKRWYSLNKESVDEQISERVRKEEELKRQKEEQLR